MSTLSRLPPARRRQPAARLGRRLHELVPVRPRDLAGRGAEGRAAVPVHLLPDGLHPELRLLPASPSRSRSCASATTSASSSPSASAAATSRCSSSSPSASRPRAAGAASAGRSIRIFVAAQLPARRCCSSSRCMAFNLAGGSFWPVRIPLQAVAFGLIVAGLGAAACVYLYFEYKRITGREAAAAAAPQRPARAALSRSLLAHLGLVGGRPGRGRGSSSASSCRPPARRAARSPSATASGCGPSPSASSALAAILYVVGLSAVRWWTGGLRRRGVADARAARDWYLLAGGLGPADRATAGLHARIGPSLGLAA